MGRAQTKQTKTVGRDWPQKRLGRSRPKTKCLFSLGPDRPRLPDWARTILAQTKLTGGGGNFLPPSPSPACRRKNKMQRYRGEEKEPGAAEAVLLDGVPRWWRYGGGRLRSWLTNGGAATQPAEKQDFFLFPSFFHFRYFSLSLPFSLFSVFFSFVFGLFPSSFPFLLFVLSPPSGSLSLRSSPLFFFFFRSPVFFGFFSIYRGRTGAGTIGSAPGSGFRGWLQPPVTAKRDFFTFGRWSANDFGRWSHGVGPSGCSVEMQGRERREVYFKKQSFSFCCRCGGGEEERGTVPFKTTPFGPFFVCMKRHRFG